MATVAATVITNDVENVKPNLNVPLEAPVSLKTPIVQPVPEEVPAEANEEEEEEEDEDYEEEEEEEDDMDSDADEHYGEQSLEGFPLSAEEEAREAADLARSLGLGSTNEAISRVGAGSDKRISKTIDTYSELIRANQPEATQVYEGLSEEITALRASIQSGIHKIVSDMNVTATPSAVELSAAALENYLRVIAERSVVHCEYRDEQEVSPQDVLVTLSALGRPVYWGEQATSTLVQGAIKDEEDESVDGDFVPMEDGEELSDEEVEEEDDEDEEMDTWDGKEGEGEEEAPMNFESAAFRRLVDVVNRWQVSISDAAYTILQTSVEDYVNQLFSTASSAAQFAGRKEIEPVDVRFAQSIVLKI